MSWSRFLTKTAKIRHYWQCLQFIYWTLGRNFPPLWSNCFGKWNNHMLALLMIFLRIPLFTLIYYLLLHSRYCKAYQNCLVALIKIMTVLASNRHVSKNHVKAKVELSWKIKNRQNQPIFGQKTKQSFFGTCRSSSIGSFLLTTPSPLI